MVKIVAISDLHGKTNFSIPQCDLLLIAGDICPNYGSDVVEDYLQMNWLEGIFFPWLKRQPAKEVVACFGNHDWIGITQFVEIRKSFEKYNGWHYLQDSFVTVDGLKIYGSPWSLPFCNWAFYLSEEKLELAYNLIPSDTDILISHSPPYRVLDKVQHANFVKNCGSKALKNKVLELNIPLCVFGHIHDNGGKFDRKENTLFANVSLLNDNYDMVNKPMVFSYDDKKFEVIRGI